MRDADPRVIQNYIVWRVLLQFALFLPGDAQEPMYKFKAFLAGLKEDVSPWLIDRLLEADQ